LEKSSREENGVMANPAHRITCVLEDAPRVEDRQRLDRATSDYFNCLSRKSVDDEEELARALIRGTEGIDFNRE
jgi:hypothetical protein